MKEFKHQNSNKLEELSSTELVSVFGGVSIPENIERAMDIGYYKNGIWYETSDPSTRKKKHTG